MPTLGNQWGLVLLVAAEIAIVVIRSHLGTVAKAIVVVLLIAAAALSLLTLSYTLINIDDSDKRRERLLRSGWVLPFVVGPFALVVVVFFLLASWTFVPIVVAILLGVLLLAIGKLHPRRYFWYGMSVFVSVALFGAVLTYNRTFHAPSAQAAAVLLKNGQVVEGVWIGESSSRVFLGRLPTSDGRIFWIERDRVASESVGKLVRTDRATKDAAELAKELEADAGKIQANDASTGSGGSGSGSTGPSTTGPLPPNNGRDSKLRTEDTPRY